MVKTSWQPVSRWYNQLQGNKGDFFHDQLIIPQSLRLLSLAPESSLLDLACGNGILGRQIPQITRYLGLDAASDLIKVARRLDQNSQHEYLVFDVTQPLPITTTTFTHATIILALQNIASPQLVLTQAAKFLQPEGILLIVLNHPCFRIPRQSSWQIDPQNKLEYRRINRYLTPLKIPITTHPGQKTSPLTWSFHEPLSNYFHYLKKSGFFIEQLEEWASPKTSVGKNSRAENFSRREFPLFLAILARRKS